MDNSPLPRLSRTRRALYLALGFAVAALVTFGVLEIVVRVFFPQPESMRWLVPDQRYGHLMHPNFHQRYPFIGFDFVMDVRTNSLGLRDDELPPHQAGVKTVLFLGDSFAFGHGVNVEDRFDTVLARLLERSEQPYRLINAGVGGWGTVQQTRFARDHFDVFQPDVIVLIFCGNDPDDDDYFAQKGQSFDRLYFPGKAFLRHHSHLFRLVNHRAYLLLHNFYLNRKKAANPGKAVDVQTASMIRDVQWQATLETLRGFHRDFLEFNPGGVLLLVSSEPTFDDIRERLGSLDNGSNLLFVDMKDRTSGLSWEQKRLPHDGHWSLLMHTIVAERLRDALLALEHRREPGV